jgi:hypothetical protein
MIVPALLGDGEAMSASATVFRQQYFHGTKADLAPGDLISVGYDSNFGDGAPMSWVYCSGTLDAAIWGAELAAGDGEGRIYVVEPVGEVVDDPNLTDKKFPGNPTMSYRSREPLRVVGEVVKWSGHSAEMVEHMKSGVARLKSEGAEIID